MHALVSPRMEMKKLNSNQCKICSWISSKYKDSRSLRLMSTLKQVQRKEGAGH